tara:strand:+ start:45 stop:1247 length:1203 start_codon:yes stop_codon:yes gene_type:complete
MRKYNKRLVKLGTETAFSVSSEANILSKNGKKIYPFHLGDINIPTPNLIRKTTRKYIDSNKNGYCPSEGILEFREALAQDIGSKRGVVYNAENVIIQPGGKPTIWKFLTCVMNKGDQVLYPNPGYPIYESQIRFQGGEPIPYGFNETAEGYKINLDELKSLINEKTTILIYNNYQNPTSASSTKDEIESLAKLCIENDLWVLSDDAYFEIRYSDEPPLSIVNIPGMRERTAILYTFSKRFAMTGWRIGATIGPKNLMNQITRLNVNDESCTNHFIQCALAEIMGLVDDEAKLILSELEERKNTCVESLNSISGISLINPESTFYLYLNIKNIMIQKNYNDIERFRLDALDQIGFSFCTRHHFGAPKKGEDDRYIRLAYSGINKKEILEGMKIFKDWLENS